MKGTAELMLRDFTQELIAKATAAKAEATTKPEDYFEKGRHFGLYEALSLLVSQAEAFQMDKASIGLEGVDPDRDLLGL